ncbi:hypothetical protein NQZ68_010248 [Dissostichus eleginoides]|nr:hypothetical protein NQZ68_010248 [Dissostichus eleginoides]
MDRRGKAVQEIRGPLFCSKVSFEGELFLPERRTSLRRDAAFNANLEQEFPREIDKRCVGDDVSELLLYKPTMEEMKTR